MEVQRWMRQKRMEATLRSNFGRSTYKTAFLYGLSALADLGGIIYFLEMTQRRYGAEQPLWPIEVATGIGFVISTALLSWLLLPVALSHDTREFAEWERYPGKWYSLVAGLIICVSAGANPLRLSVVITYVSLCSRRSLAWALGACSAIIGSLLIRFVCRSNFETPGLSIGATLLFILLLAVSGLFVSRLRAARLERQIALLAHAERSADETAQLEKLARQQERDHIARDMHDSLSHRLSLISVYAGALNFNKKLDAGTVRETAGKIQKEAEEAVQELRSVLRTLRTESHTDPREGLELLVDKARASGSRVSAHYDPPEAKSMLDKLPSMAVHTLNHAIQEGLTNARKYAPGQRIRLRVSQSEGQLLVSMSNKKPVQPSESRGGGYGLIGLAERARLIGGEFEIADDSEQFSWSLLLPGEG